MTESEGQSTCWTVCIHVVDNVNSLHWLAEANPSHGLPAYFSNKLPFWSIKLEFFLKAEGESWEKRQKWMETSFGRCCYPSPQSFPPDPKEVARMLLFRWHSSAKGFSSYLFIVSPKAQKHNTSTKPTPDTPEKKIITGLIPDVVIEKWHTEVTSSTTQLITRSGQRRTINQRSWYNRHGSYLVCSTALTQKQQKQHHLILMLLHLWHVQNYGMWLNYMFMCYFYRFLSSLNT